MTILNIGTPPMRLKLDRRKLLQLSAAAMALPACGPQTSDQAAQARAAGIAPWPKNIKAPVVTAEGYGLFPDYYEIGETGPWPKILSQAHRKGLELFSDVILPGTDMAPAPSEIGIGDFWDDWVSAPYPYMTGTRQLVHEGFAWLDAQSRIEFARDWNDLSLAEATRIVTNMQEASTEDGPMVQAANMYQHLRKIIIGAYYTTPEGEDDLGHVAAGAREGDYPGPTGEALDHIRELILAQGLNWDDLPVGPPPYPNIEPYTFDGGTPK